MRKLLPSLAILCFTASALRADDRDDCWRALQPTTLVVVNNAQEALALQNFIDQSNYSVWQKNTRLSAGARIGPFRGGLDKSYDAFHQQRSAYTQRLGIEYRGTKAESYSLQYLPPELAQVFLDCKRIPHSGLTAVVDE